jgi:membrane protein implicated in regulation of membrane protease activity
VTKARAKNRKKRRHEHNEGTQVPSWGPGLLQFIVMFTIMALLKGLLSSDGLSGKTFLWAILVAATLTAINEWQRRRKKAKVKNQ